MKRTFIWLTLASIFLVAAPFIVAADLKNEDGKKYEVRVHEGAITKNKRIGANERIKSICSSCVIEVVGVGKISAKGSDVVFIRGGKLFKK